jgi:PAS domain S-box-containing protein
MKRYRTILAIASPFIACAIQWLFWQSIQPLVWFLFYPAVFISAWIGGFWTGLVSTFIATTLAFLFFINPNYPISMIHTKTFITLSVFLTMGTLFSVLLGRLKKLNEQLSSDLRQNEISQKEEKKSLEIKYRSIMESVTDYIVVLDKDQRIQYNNHVAAGLEWEDVKGTDWLLWLEDKDRNIASDAFQLARNTGKPTECEFRAIEAYGKMTSFNAKFAPILGSSEDIVLLATNITDRKNKEHELLDSEEKYRLIMQTTTDFVVILNKEFRITYVNRIPKERRMEDVLNSEFLKWIYDEDLASVRDRLDFTLKSREISHCEYRVVTPDGSFRVYQLQISILSEKEDNLVLFSSDITDRKKAEQALGESEIKYRSIMESVGDTIVVLDKDLRIQYINRVSEGFTESDVKGSYWLDWLEPSDRSSAAYAISETIQLNKPIETEVNAIGAFEKMTTFNVKFAPISDKEQSIVLIAKDVTEKKNAEIEILRLNAELEQRVINRTKQLEEANKELEAFSYSVSHDLRSPLRAINGYTNILLEDYFPILDEEGKRVCNVISSEATRMGKLIDDLLSFSRLSRMDMQFSLINMKAMAQRVFDELIQMEKTRKIEFNLSDIPSIQGDSVLIRQVWMNLISNAIKFTSKKEKAIIEISAKELDSEIVYSVTDNGAGFDMKYADKLFGVFQRLHKESEFEGTGVGLAIIKRAVMRNGGRVRAKGEIDKGATLYFALPKKNVKWEI